MRRQFYYLHTLVHDVINSNDRSLGTPGQGLFVPIPLKSGGLEQGRRAGRKADGTLDRRLKANRSGPMPPPPPPPPPLQPSPSPSSPPASPPRAAPAAPPGSCLAAACVQRAVYSLPAGFMLSSYPEPAQDDSASAQDDSLGPGYETFHVARHCAKKTIRIQCSNQIKT